MEEAPPARFDRAEVGARPAHLGRQAGERRHGFGSETVALSGF
jgi:hypothetical protein